MAYKTLIALHVDSFPVQPLEILTFCKNTVIHTYEEAMLAIGQYDYAFFKYDFLSGQDAVTFRRVFPDGKTAYEVLYDSQGDRRRRRFTLAHELGHIVLRHSQEEPWEEREADYFAAQLLAPRPVFPLLNSAGLDTSSAEQLASLFCLSRKASEVAVLPPYHTVTDPETAMLLCSQFAQFISSQFPRSTAV